MWSIPSLDMEDNTNSHYPCLLSSCQQTQHLNSSHRHLWPATHPAESSLYWLTAWDAWSGTWRSRRLILLVAKVKDMLEGGGEAGSMTRQPRYSVQCSTECAMNADLFPVSKQCFWSQCLKKKKKTTQIPIFYCQPVGAFTFFFFFFFFFLSKGDSCGCKIKPRSRLVWSNIHAGSTEWCCAEEVQEEKKVFFFFWCLALKS